MSPGPLRTTRLHPGSRPPRPPAAGTAVALGVFVVVVLVALAGTSGAVTTTIGFEEFSEGTALTTQYEDRGILFEEQQGGAGGAIVTTCDAGNPACDAAHNGENAAITPEEEQGTPTVFGTPREPLVVSFSEPQTEVSLYVQGGGDLQGSQLATLTARNGNGEVVAESTLQFEVGTGWHRIAVTTDSAVISRVTLTLAVEGNLDDPHNIMAVDDLTIRRNEPPTAVFEFSPSEPAVDTGVTFDASNANDIDGEIVEYRWDLDDDGSIDTITQEPTVSDYEYVAPGTYYVTLVVVDNEGATDRHTREITVVGEPVARCRISDTEVQTGEQVVIDASRSNAELVRFDTNGDGTFDRTSTGSLRVFVTYQEAGTYSPVVLAEFGDTVDEQRCSTITVTRRAPFPWTDLVVGGTGGVIGLWVLRRVYPDSDGDDNDNDGESGPAAKIVSAPDEPAPGRPVILDGTLSFDPDSGDRVVSYRWTVGDRELTVPRFVHVFLETGKQDVELEVVDSSGAMDEATETIEVTESEGELVLDRVQPDAPGDDHENLPEEYLVFRNEGDAALSLAGWTIHDAAEEEGRVSEGDHTFTFPDGFELEPDQAVRIHTGSASADGKTRDEGRDLYWEKSRAVWNNEQDIVVVEDGDGHPVIAVRYEQTDAGNYTLENLDPALLDEWFPEMGSSGPGNGLWLGLAGFVAGATFLKGPRAFLNRWANISGYVISASLTWGLVTVTGFVPQSIEPIIPILLSAGSLAVTLIGGLLTVLHWLVSKLAALLS